MLAYTSHLQSVGGRNYFNRLDQRFGLLTQNPDRRPIHSFSHQNRQLVSDRFDDADACLSFFFWVRRFRTTCETHKMPALSGWNRLREKRAHSESNQIRRSRPSGANLNGPEVRGKETARCC